MAAAAKGRRRSMSRKQCVCMTCHKRFDAINDRQRFCSKPCYLAAKRNGYVPSAIRRPPEPVHIRLPQPLPVFPEFQLTPGVVYKAEKHFGQLATRAFYIVTLDKNHRTIVRQEECEEVDHE